MHCHLCGNKTRSVAPVSSVWVCQRCAHVIHDRHRNVPDAPALMPLMSVGRAPSRRVLS